MGRAPRSTEVYWRMRRYGESYAAAYWAVQRERIRYLRALVAAIRT